jgi:hypothetical protein
MALYAWTLDLRDGTTVIFDKTFAPQRVWPVSGGN